MTERIRPPWWLKPMNKALMALSKLGVMGKGAPLVLTVTGRKSGQFPTLVPTGVGFMKKAGLVSEGRPEEFEALAGRCAVFRFDAVSV